LADHPALTAALADHPTVVPLFVLDPALLDPAGAPRRAALVATLRALDRSMGGALVVRVGDPHDVVPSVTAEVGADTVYVTRDGGPYGRRRDDAVAVRLREADRRLRGVGWPYLAAPGSVTKADGTPYRVFTPFFRAWRTVAATEPLPAPRDPDWHPLRSDAWPDAPELPFDLPPLGEEAATARWTAFRDGALDHYDDRRDLPAVDGTSRLSVDLRWGTLHPRQLLAELDDLRDDGDGPAAAAAYRTFASELAWRDFYADVLLHHPRSGWVNLDTRMDAMPVDTDAAARRRFERWAAGTTGFPIVDAGMRQLLATGWMHNRVRMIVASFLVKDLHLPWQWGARHFMAHLVDGDLASNSHGWQWAAGTGTDAAPYFRVFNPTSQQARYDPDGAYVARWLPELGTDDYPAPMVDHAAERLEALARYKSLTAR
jgi:deoxyribodipyrimidine photo-lyase